MNCNKIHELIDMYVDGNLSEAENREIEKHMEECDDCKAMVEDMLSLKDMLGNLPELDLPENFEAELHNKLVEEASQNTLDKKVKTGPWGFFNKYKYTLSTVAAVFVVAVILTTGGLDELRGGMESDMSYDTVQSTEYAESEATEAAPEMAVMMEAKEESKESYGVATDRSAPVTVTFNEGVDVDTNAMDESNYTVTSEPTIDALDGDAATKNAGITIDAKSLKTTADDNTGRLVIHNGSVSLETEEYDEVEKKILERTVELDGFVMNSGTRIVNTYRGNKEYQLRIGSFTLRVPEQHFYNYFEELGSMGKVTSTWSHSDDITKNYRDAVSDIENYKAQEERLREILEKAETVEEILNIEKELSRVRGDINRLEGTVKNWDHLVKLSTINVEVIEVINLKDEVKPIDKNMFQKAREGFIETINNLIDLCERAFIKIVSLSPVLVIGAVAFGVGYWIYRVIRKRRRS